MVFTVVECGPGEVRPYAGHLHPSQGTWSIPLVDRPHSCSYCGALLSSVTSVAHCSVPCSVTNVAQCSVVFNTGNTSVAQCSVTVVRGNKDIVCHPGWREQMSPYYTLAGVCWSLLEFAGIGEGYIR